MTSAPLIFKPGLLRLALAAWLATLAGCAAPGVAKFERKRTGRVYCVRGFLDVFSLGMNGLAERLREEGVDARAMSGPAWPSAARQIESDFTPGADQEPLILVGHSYGADHAIDIAKHVEQLGIRVRLLVLLDATVPPTVPANVERCLHLYKPTLAGDLLPFVFAGNPVEPDPANEKTQLVNEVISTESLGPKAETVNHFNIDKSEVVHAFVVKEIIQVCPLWDATPEVSDSYGQGPPAPTLKAIHATP